MGGCAGEGVGLSAGEGLGLCAGEGVGLCAGEVVGLCAGVGSLQTACLTSVTSASALFNQSST